VLSLIAGRSPMQMLLQTVVQHLDQNLAPMVFVGFFLTALAIALMAIENRSRGLNAASARVWRLP
jgi:hypothetical protein